MAIESFRDLNAWKENYKLVLMTYKLTKVFPKEELFGLTNQVRRAVISIVSNIAEGFGRQTMKEKVQFYSTALGSACEVEAQIMIAKGLSYISENEATKLLEQTIVVNKLLHGLIKASKARILVNHSS